MADDSRWDLLTLKLEHLHRDVSLMQGAIKDLAGAVSKLALVEERQANATAALERAFKAIDALEARVAELEKAAPDAGLEGRVLELEKVAPDTRRITGWVYAAIGAVIIASALAAFGFKKG